MLDNEPSFGDIVAGSYSKSLNLFSIVPLLLANRNKSVYWTLVQYAEGGFVYYKEIKTRRIREIVFAI